MMLRRPVECTDTKRANCPPPRPSLCLARLAARRPSVYEQHQPDHVRRSHVARQLRRHQPRARRYERYGRLVPDPLALDVTGPGREQPAGPGHLAPTTATPRSTPMTASDEDFLGLLYGGSAPAARASEAREHNPKHGRRVS